MYATYLSLNLITHSNMAQRAKGDGLGRKGGRQKGTPNKATATIRAAIKQIVEENMDDFVRSFKALDDKDKCKLYIDLCKFVVPALSSVEIKDVSDNRNAVADRVRELRDQE